MKTDKEVLGSANRILRENKLLTLATLGKSAPYANTAFYTFDKNFNLYIWSENGSIHEKNVLKNRKVAVNIFDSSQKWGAKLQGLQATGTATKVNNKELLKAGLLYLKRFPKALLMVKSPKNFHNKMFETTLYKIKLDWIKVFDEKNFGKEEHREIRLKQNGHLKTEVSGF